MTKGLGKKKERKLLSEYTGHPGPCEQSQWGEPKIGMPKR